MTEQQLRERYIANRPTFQGVPVEFTPVLDSPEGRMYIYDRAAKVGPWSADEFMARLSWGDGPTRPSKEWRDHAIDKG